MIRRIGWIFYHSGVFLFKKIGCQSRRMRRRIFMAKHNTLYNHFLKDFWNALNGVQISCNCFASLQFDGLDQSCTSDEIGIHYSFSFLYVFSLLLVWDHFQRPTLYFRIVLERQKMVFMFYYP